MIRKPIASVALIVSLICAPVLYWRASIAAQPSGNTPVDLSAAGLMQYEFQEIGGLPSEPTPEIQAEVKLAGSTYRLELQRHSMRADDFRLLVQGADGELRPVEPPPPCTYRGTAVGIGGSHVRASLIDGQLSAEIVLPGGEHWYVDPVSELVPGTPPSSLHAAYQAADVWLEGQYRCGTDESLRLEQEFEGDGGGGTTRGLTGNVICDFAADADVQFYNQNGGSVPNTVRDIENIVNRMENIYDAEVDIVYETTVIVVRTVEPDPYSSTDPGTRLDQFRTEWNTNPQLGADVRRDTAQLFTGANLDGGVIGIAFLGTICSSRTSGTGYSVVQSRFTSNLVSRTCLSAHETGHSWNASHCDGAPDCGIMCSGLGGCSGSCTTFGASEESDIESFRNSRTCLLDEELPLTIPFLDDFPTTTLDPVKWSYRDSHEVNANASNEPSAPNSLNLDAIDADPWQDDDVRSNFIQLAGQSNVRLSYRTEHVGVEAGEQLLVQYWNNNLTWVTINTISSDGVNQSTFDSWQHTLPADALHNEFRVRFRPDVNEANDDWYIDDVSVAVGTCLGDLDGDGDRDLADLAVMLANYGTSGPAGDLDNDGDVDLADLATFLALYGVAC